MKPCSTTINISSLYINKGQLTKSQKAINSNQFIILAISPSLLPFGLINKNISTNCIPGEQAVQIRTLSSLFLLESKFPYMQQLFLMLIGQLIGWFASQLCYALLQFHNRHAFCLKCSLKLQQITNCKLQVSK